MMTERETAERAAFKVGYNSSSQFNREYSRMFGNSPVRDIIQIKQNGNIIRPI
jgi:AraC-like DNA-binding protein